MRSKPKLPKVNFLKISISTHFKGLKKFVSCHVLSMILGALLIAGSIYGYYYYQQTLTHTTSQQDSITNLTTTNTDLSTQLSSVSAALAQLEQQDQYLINQTQEEELKNIKDTYTQAVTTYESLVKYREQSKDTETMDETFTAALTLLSDQNYASAAAELTALNKEISTKQQELASKFSIPASAVTDTNPPANGYRRQRVSTSIGDYLVDIVAGDLSSTRVIVDTASGGDCGNDCPVLPLSDYVSRNGGYAGINGSYFCPASYPSCAGKTNSFDTLLMNKDKVYFNSDNNVYSNVPAVIFGNDYVRFVGRSSDWGRDTSISSMIANQPLTVSGGKSVFGGDGDPKKGSKGSRSFVANKGNTVYIGVVHNVSVAESGLVLETMGMDNALNLDSGGSTALWSGGYKAGPGRNIPNAIVFVRK